MNEKNFTDLKGKNGSPVKCIQCKGVCTHEELKIASAIISDSQGSLWAEFCFDCIGFYEKYHPHQGKASEPNIKNNHGYSCISTCECKGNEKYILDELYPFIVSDEL